MNLPELISGLSIVGGAICGAVWGFTKFGFFGAVVGLPVGGIIGWVVVFALPLLLIIGAVAIVLWVKDGAPAARRFLWGRGEKPPTDTTSLGG